MTTKNKYNSWTVKELESILDMSIYERDHSAETYSDRADLNKEIQLIKSEIERREKSE